MDVIRGRDGEQRQVEEYTHPVDVDVDFDVSISQRVLGKFKGNLGQGHGQRDIWGSLGERRAGVSGLAHMHAAMPWSQSPQSVGHNLEMLRVLLVIRLDYALD